MPKLLTRRKQAWADKRKPDILRGGALNYNAAAEARYYAQLAALIKRMTKETREKIESFFTEPHAEEYFAQDASVSSQARILTNAIAKKFDQIFAFRAKPLAESTVREADKNSSTALHSSLKDLSGGLSFKTTVLTGELEDVISASVTENVGLIKSIASQYLGSVQGAVMRSITTGNGLQDLVPFLNKQEGITLRRARIIAQDQTRKAYANISKIRMQKLGLKQFEWLHSSGGAEPRKLHIELSGKIFDFDNPPVIDLKSGERGFPAQLPNCRCRYRPVITFAGE